jgi:hypothetical protein
MDHVNHDRPRMQQGYVRMKHTMYYGLYDLLATCKFFLFYL